MTLDYPNIPVSARSSVESLLLWCAEQLATRNAGVQVKERQSTVADSGLEFAAAVSKFKGPEGNVLAVARVTLALPDDYALSKSWEVAEQISEGAAAASYYV